MISFQLGRKIADSARHAGTGPLVKDCVEDYLPSFRHRKGNFPVAISYSTAPKENKSCAHLVLWPAPAPATYRRLYPSIVPGLVRCFR